MEFIQFYPWRCIDPFDRSRVAIQPSTFVLGARLYNSLGERFMGVYDEERFEATTRDVAARGIFDQIRKGLGKRGGVVLDLSPLSPEEFAKSNPKVWRALQNRNIDYRNYEFIVAPEAHYFMGGVSIDQDGQTSMPGLFAAGEVAGGIQGANRLNSNALPETQVFGKRAGIKAADFARQTGPGKAPHDQIRRYEDLLSNANRNDSAPYLADIHQEFTSKVGTSLGIIRNAATLQGGLDYVRNLRRSLEQNPPGGRENLRQWHELLFMSDVAELSLTAAFLRTESRGAHYREDYPEQNDREWRKAIVLRRDPNGDISTTVKSVGETPSAMVSGGGLTVAQPAIALRGVYKAFTSTTNGRTRGFMALNNVDLSIEYGEFVSIVGPSGCGKSTVMNLVAGLIAPTEGEVKVKGRPVRGLNVGIGYITQEDNLFPWRTLIDNVAYGLELRGVPRETRYRKAAEYLARVGLEEFENHYPHQLSGGMRKRGAILRTLICDPDVILMDEPFGPLDAQTRSVLQNDLLELWEGSGKTILFITHDLVESIALSDRVVVMSRAPGRVKSIHKITLPRPRDVFHIHQTPGFAELHDAIWSDLRSEIRI